MSKHYLFGVLHAFISWLLYASGGAYAVEWSVTSTAELFNKVSNGAGSGVNSGNSIMTFGDTTVLAVGEYRCAEGTCAGSHNMLYTQHLYGQINCEDDSAPQCVLDGEGSRRGMHVFGSGSGKLTLRSLTFKDGDAVYGGGVHIHGAIVDITLCAFVNNTANGGWGGGGICVDSAQSNVNIIASSFQSNLADGGNGNDLYRSDGTLTVVDECPAPYLSNSPTKGSALDISGHIDGSKFSYSGCPFYLCEVGHFNPTLGASNSDCETCPYGRTSTDGSTSCLLWLVSDMTELYNKISNSQHSSSNAGNAIMTPGNTTVLAVGTYKCSDGTCADVANMLFTKDLYGDIICINDNASCIVDGENTRRGIRIYGSGGQKISIRGLTVKDGEENVGGGAYIHAAAVVDLVLDYFLDNRAIGSSDGQGGGAIFVHASGTVVKIYGTVFEGNLAERSGNDIYKSDGSITIFNVCPSPYSSNTPVQGAELDISGTISGSSYSYKCDYICEAGNYNPDRGLLSSDCVACAGGKFSPSTAATSESTCSFCASGEFSGESSTSCTACAGGKHLINSATADESLACTSCGAGEFSSPGSSSSDCSACPPGRYLTNAATGVESDACTLCGTGKYSSATAATSESTCTVCPQGSYTETEGTVACQSCPAGRFNSDAANSSLHDSLTDCAICPIGTINPNPATNASLHTSCEACLPGKFNADDGVNVLVHDDIGDCLFCDVGKFSYNLNGATTCEDCPSGLISGSGASSCSTCPTGYLCVEGVVSSPCPAGRYSNGTKEECSECVIGYKCPGGTDKIPCPPGSYSNSSSQHTCESCEAGKFQSNEAKDSCLPCNAGHFCPASSITPLPCLSGSTFQPDPGQTSCKSCSNCPLGKVMNAECTITTDLQCSLCTAPSYSDDGLACKECDGEGQYNDKHGASFCKIAPAGTKPSANRTTVELCPKNHFSIGAKDTCSVCPDGGHSKPGSFACEKCSTGEYFNETENACGICPKNTFTLSGATSIDGCTPCQNAGEFAKPGSGYCEKCPQYEEFDELTEGCACMTSFEKIGGTCTCKVGETLMGTSCSPCELGKWKNESGVTSCSRCETTLSGAITANRGSSEESACICPMATYDNGEGKCVEIVEGIRNDIEGLTLETLTLFPGWWRTSNTSDDIRECIIAGACLGGNSTNMCREGHTGPYCNVCVENYNPDPFGVCKECSYSTIDLVLTIVAVVSFVLLFFLFKFLVTKKLGKNGKGKHVWKKIKNGVKVIFASGQITASLPRVIPSLALPNSYEKVVEASQVLKLDIFTLVPVGCWTGGTFNYYNRTAAMSIPVIALCGALFFLGILMKRRRAKIHTAAIAVMYLTLPTITTTVFGLFPCDLLDDGREFLRGDYHIRCDDDGRGGWETFGIAMVVIFPVCVPAFELFLLWRVKESIMKPAEEREKDNSIKDLMFLWDPYKPEFWYWEVAETTRRLGMTGLLSIIKPGTFTQLATGLMMGVLYTVLLAKVEPYKENRDNDIAILSSALIVGTFIASFLMKSQTMVEDSYEAVGIGILLCVSSAALIALFVVWGWKSFNDVAEGKSGSALAIGAVRGRKEGEKEGGKGSEVDTDVSKEAEGGGEDRGVGGLKDDAGGEKGGIQMHDIYTSELEDKTRSSSVFGVSNPIGMSKGKVKEGRGGTAETKRKDAWEKFNTEGSGEEYYYNAVTGETSWEKPE